MTRGFNTAAQVAAVKAAAVTYAQEAFGSTEMHIQGDAKEFRATAAAIVQALAVAWMAGYRYSRTVNELVGDE